MISAGLVLLGGALVVLALADAPVRRLPLSPALIYLVLGGAAGFVLAGPNPWLLADHAHGLRLPVEFALLASLFVIGLRMRQNPTLREWRVALLLAGPTMVLTIGLAAAAAWWLLALPWAAALLLAAVLAPTDPVLASEVQVRSDADRDAVRLSLTAEGGLNDASAWPVVALALGLLGLHDIGSGASRWLWADLAWPLLGGAALGTALGLGLGRAMRWRLADGDPMARDELVQIGAIALAFGLASALAVSTFLVAFTLGATLLLPLRAPEHAEAEQALAARLAAFGARLERLVEAATVLAVGALLAGLRPGWAELGFALLLAFAVRPLAVLLTVPGRLMPSGQRRLVAWFGIRGLGSLFYLLLALEQGTGGTFAEQLVRVTLLCIALSIVLHGVSATPLMAAYQRRRDARRAGSGT